MDDAEARSTSAPAGNADELLSPDQTWALLDELESATRLVELGIGELHRMSLGNDFYHLPIQLLAQGLERFLKLTLAMALVRDQEVLPRRSAVRDHGHDLVSLTEALTDEVASASPYMRRPAVQEDLQFIREDDDFRRLLSILSDFGQRDRYHRLDAFLDPGSVEDERDPRRRWESFESEISRRSPEWSTLIGSPGGTDDLLERTNAYLAGLLDRFARALARMWTLGALPHEASRFQGLVKPFLFLRDEELGIPRPLTGGDS